MKLFYTPTSPYARKARIVIRERGLMNQSEEILATPYQDDPKLLAVNPAGLVPTLALDDGTSLIDSILICEYLDATANGPQLRHAHGQERWNDQHATTLAQTIMDFAVAATMEDRRTDGVPSSSFIARKKEKIKRCLLSLAEKSNAPTNSPSLGDIATVCALSYLDLRLSDLDWRTQRSDLIDWHIQIESRPAFTQTLPDELKN